MPPSPLLIVYRYQETESYDDRDKFTRKKKSTSEDIKLQFLEIKREKLQRKKN